MDIQSELELPCGAWLKKNKLLRGEVAHADLRGPLKAGGAVHRRLTPFKAYRVLRAQSEVAWYARRLGKLAKGRSLESLSSPSLALVRYMSADMAHALRRKPPAFHTAH